MWCSISPKHSARVFFGGKEFILAVFKWNNILGKAQIYQGLTHNKLAVDNSNSSVSSPRLFSECLSSWPQVSEDRGTGAGCYWTPSMPLSPYSCENLRHAHIWRHQPAAAAAATSPILRSPLLSPGVTHHPAVNLSPGAEREETLSEAVCVCVWIWVYAVM